MIGRLPERTRVQIEPGTLWPQVRSFVNLHAAWRAARKGKRNRTAVARFGFDVDSGLLDLQYAPDTGQSRHGAYRQFTLYERKPRVDTPCSPFSFACR